MTTNVVYNGAATGAINLTASGGTATYSFNWGGGITTEDRSGLAPGTYTVTISDTNGCTATRSTTITQPATALSSSTVAVNNANCSNPGSIDISVAGGTAGYVYLWSNTATSQDISGLSAGSYSVTITDANGCSVSNGPLTVSSVATPTASLSNVSNVSCNGGSNGAVNITVTGGTPGYSFIWSNGATTEDINGLQAGSYCITVTDNLGCVANVSAVNITAPAVLSGSATVSNISCNGQANGSVNLTASGGTAPYAYNWGSGITSEDRSGLSAGTYTLTVTDANGCITTQNALITQPTAISASLITLVNASCVIGGSVDINVSGGSGGYSYLWSNSANTQDISGLSAGNFTVTISDANACTFVSGPYAINAVGTPNAVVANQSAPSCNGFNNGSINISVSGGNPAYTYLWSNGATTEDLNGITAGNYSVTVTDNLGCNASVSNISLIDPTQISVSNSISDALCNGASDGSVSLIVNGGTAPYSYLWNNGGTTQSLNGISAGTYSFTVTDANGCISQNSAFVSEPALPLVATVDSIINSSGANDGSINISTGGGTPAYSYLWINGTTTQDINGLAAGSYTVTITDANGCTTSISATLVISDAAGIHNINNFNVLPNPNDGNFNILINLTRAETYTVQLVDVIGRVLADWNCNQMDNNIAVGLNYLSPGIYFVVLKQENGITSSKKLIITK